MSSPHTNKQIKTIIVHQMGKVGSRSIINALEKLGLWEVVQLHQLNEATLMQTKKAYEKRKIEIPLHLKEAERIRKEIIKAKKSCCIITMVREPIARNFSAFFQNLDFYNINLKSLNQKKTDDIIQEFLNKYHHDVPLTWFDQQINKSLGIDVYQYPFHHGKGYQIIEKGRTRMLILKCESPDKIKVHAIAEYLGIDPFSMPRINIGDNKHYAQAYKVFKEQARLPVEYVKRMCDSRYMRHFYSKHEILKIKNYWDQRAIIL